MGQTRTVRGVTCRDGIERYDVDGPEVQELPGYALLLLLLLLFRPSTAPSPNRLPGGAQRSAVGPKGRPGAPKWGTGGLQSSG